MRSPCRYDCDLGWMELSLGNVPQPSEVLVAGSLCQGFLQTAYPGGLVRDHNIGCFLMASVGRCISMFHIGLLQRSSTG